MSSFPKHSFEQAYDHAFPPSPPTQHQTTLPTVSERSPLISKAPSSAQQQSGNPTPPQLLHPGASYTSNDSTASYVTANTSVSGDETDTLLEHGRRRGSDQRSVQSDTAHLSVKEITIREFKILLKYSGPVVLTYVLQNSLQLASLVSLGHLGSIGKFFFPSFYRFLFQLGLFFFFFFFFFTAVEL